MTRREILGVAKQDELPCLARWVDLSVRLGWMTLEEATDWRVLLVGLSAWFELTGSRNADN